MDREELLSEAQLTFTRCLPKINTLDEKEFTYYFKRACSNRIKDLQKVYLFNESRGYMSYSVPIEEYHDLEERSLSSTCYILGEKELIEQITHSLSEVDRTIFICLSNPPKELMRTILIEFRKKEKKLKEKGFQVKAGPKVMAKHVSEFLNIPTRKMTFALKRIRTAIKEEMKL